MMFELFTARSNLLPYAFVLAPYICMGKMLRLSNDVSSLKPLSQFAQISYGASLGRGNERLLKWSQSVDQDGAMPIYGKNL